MSGPHAHIEWCHFGHLTIYTDRVSELIEAVSTIKAREGGSGHSQHMRALWALRALLKYHAAPNGGLIVPAVGAAGAAGA